MRELIRHIIREQRTKWSDENLEIEAKKYQSRGDFQKNSNSAYIVARNKGKDFFDKITKHMTNKLNYWSDEELEKIASQYKTKNDFRKGNPKAYNASLRKGNDFHDEITSHMNPVNQEWTDENLRQEALKYDVYSDFINLSPSAYQTAKKKRSSEFLNDITKHMSKTTRWTDDALKNEALKYKTRGEFQKNNPVAYTTSLRRGILDDISSHMERAGNKYLRYIYVYEFPDKSVYVGLTFNLDKRNSGHMTQPNSSVYQHMKLTGYRPKIKSITELLDKDKASEIERKMVEKYQSEGWNILNKAKAGALGGSALKWTDEAIKNEIKKYETLNDFITKSPSAFNALKNRGRDYFEELTKDLKRVIVKLSDEELKNIALQYTDKMSFIKNEPKAYSQSKRKGDDFFNKITSHMDVKKIRWSDDMLHKESKKYKSRNAFAKGSPSAYTTARRRGLLDRFFPKK